MWKLFRQQGLPAKALKLSVKQLEDKQTKDNEKVVLESLQALGWDHIVRFLSKHSLKLYLKPFFFRFIELGKPARYPGEYQPF